MRESKCANFADEQFLDKDFAHFDPHISYLAHFDPFFSEKKKIKIKIREIKFRVNFFHKNSFKVPSVLFWIYYF